MSKRLFLGFILIALTAGQAAAQRQNELPWWYTLEQGKQYFRNGAYGDALMTFEDARRGRIAHFTRIEEDFITLLSIPEVRWLGDSLEFIERYIEDRRETRAAAALAELYHRYPKDALRGSAVRALEEMDRHKSYPEAEFWLGETYRVEGDLSMALWHYERAWEQRTLLETRGFETEILYKIADTHRIRGEYTRMEERAKDIIEGPGPSGNPRDNLWIIYSSNGVRNENPIRIAMARYLADNGVNRFLSLYRHNNPETERAHRLLGFYYYSTGRFEPATEHLMYAFLIQNTVLIDEIIRQQFDFTFTTLENLMLLTASRPELLSYIDETEYYRTAYYFASALFATGKSLPSGQLWRFLAGSSRAGEWGERARRNPSPFVENTVEMR